eukprot:Pompholyxophrys_punicea_v1_NODE_767_length_1320_cov_86.377075.p2 type:complete len:141 gc:universal NODE_767_length_1320_cov_86.377075:232-654(+)
MPLLMCHQMPPATFAKTKPSHLNNPQKFLNAPIDELAVSLGLSPLHARIRCLEYFFNVASKLPVKIGRLTKTNKAAVESIIKANQKTIKQKLKETLGIVVSQPRPGGGTSNTGNTARRFFADPHLTGSCTGTVQFVISLL